MPDHNNLYIPIVMHSIRKWEVGPEEMWDMFNRNSIQQPPAVAAQDMLAVADARQGVAKEEVGTQAAEVGNMAVEEEKGRGSKTIRHTAAYQHIIPNNSIYFC